MIGRTLSHHRVIAKLGSGGMGDVYVAEDTRLNRRVALKVLPPDLAADPDRLRRLEREAKALASLDHPNIVTVFSVEEADGVHFLTMAYIEGRTLNEVIPLRGLPMDRFMEMALALAEALRAAHKKGIVHRDLKPGNVMLGDDGRLRVLDFGLAKLESFEPADGQDLSTRTVTREGAILGTYPYMSPEQAEGKLVDSRTDLFSLGTLLYEMATGERPFKGESAAAMVSSILKDDPAPVSGKRPDLPRHLDRIIGRCLEKDPERRVQSALDLRNELESLQKELQSAVPAAPERPPAMGSAAKWGLAAAALVVALAFGWILLQRDRGSSAGEETGRTIRPLTNFVGWEWSPSWSPDGRMITYSHVVGGDADVATLSTGGGDPHILTESSPADELSPRWSPDGSKIAYLSDRGTGANVYWIPPTGGAERKLVETHIPFLERMGAWAWALGANPWSPDSKELLFSRLQENDDVALWKVDVATGKQTQLTSPTPGAEDLGGSWSFDGRQILYTRHVRGMNEVWLLPAAGGPASRILEGQSFNGTPAWFPDNRRLVFSSFRGGAPNLWELELGTKRMRQLTFGGGFDWSPTVARDGSIAYVQFSHQIDLYWIPLDKPGAEHERLTTYTGDNFGARVSPDGNLITYYSNRSGNQDLWLLDRRTGLHRQLTDHPANERLSDWSPDGKEIVFMSDRDGAVRLWILETETGVTRRLADHELPWSAHTAEGQGGPRWSPDGRVIGYPAPEEGQAIWLVEPGGGNRRASRVRGALSFGWYKDGNRVVYTRRAPDGSGLVELRAAHLETGEDRLLRSGAIAEVSVSPDGSALTFIEAVSHFTMELFLLRLSPTRTPNQLPGVVGEPKQITFGKGVWHVHSGGWAPDGRGIVYSRDRDEGDIYVIEAKRRE